MLWVRRKGPVGEKLSKAHTRILRLVHHIVPHSLHQSVHKLQTGRAQNLNHLIPLVDVCTACSLRKEALLQYCIMGMSVLKRMQRTYEKADDHVRNTWKWCTLYSMYVQYVRVRKGKKEYRWSDIQEACWLTTVAKCYYFHRWKLIYPRIILCPASILCCSGVNGHWHGEELAREDVTKPIRNLETDNINANDLNQFNSIPCIN